MCCRDELFIRLFEGHFVCYLPCCFCQDFMLQDNSSKNVVGQTHLIPYRCARNTKAMKMAVALCGTLINAWIFDYVNALVWDQFKAIKCLDDGEVRAVIQGK